MVTYAQLAEMDTHGLTGAAEAAGGLSHALSRRGDEVRSVCDFPNDVWCGVDALSASMRLAIQAGPLYRASDALSRAGAVLDGLADEIDAAREHLRGALDLIAGTGITISADGTITTPVVDSPTLADHNAELARQATEIIYEALLRAATADSAAVAALEGGDVGGDDDPVGDFFSDRFSPGVSADSNGDVSLGLGEAEHRIGIEGPSIDSGPFSVNSGGIGLTDNPYPGISLDRWPPKVSVPFVDASLPNVSVDFEEADEAADDFFTDLVNGLRGPRY